MENFKIKELHEDGQRLSPYRRYCLLAHGDIALWRVVRNELLTLLFSNIPGALGILLRRIFYPCMFKSCDGKADFGKGLTIRHAHKISLGRGCIIDDYALIDAKGSTNHGITLGAGVYIGRHSLVYCKNGDIVLGERTNLSAHCTLFSSNFIEIGTGCMIGAYSYFLSGGEYDYRDPAPFATQSGMRTRGPLKIGDDCWVGARVTVIDATGTIGNRCVIGAGTIVSKPLPEHSLAVGTPARVIRKI